MRALGCESIHLFVPIHLSDYNFSCAWFISRLPPRLSNNANFASLHLQPHQSVHIFYILSARAPFFFIISSLCIRASGAQRNLVLIKKVLRFRQARLRPLAILNNKMRCKQRPHSLGYRLFDQCWESGPDDWLFLRVRIRLTSYTRLIFSNIKKSISISNFEEPFGNA